MQMSVAKTWHQRRTHAVNNRLCSTARTAAEPRRSLCDLFDAVALNRNFAGIRIFAGTIENAHIGEEYAAGSVDSVVAVRHRHSSCFRVADLIILSRRFMSGYYIICRPAPSDVREAAGRNP